MIPGMPSIPDFKGLVTSSSDALISFGGASLIRMVFGNQWGVYSQFGIPILLADTVYSVNYQNTSQVAQAPVEKGTFASYNKVQNPYQASVVVAKGGGDPTMRGLFIAQLEALSNSTLLFNIITPEYVHRNAAIIGYDYARAPNSGARMIVANIHLEEVREVSVSYETKETANPADSAAADGGEVQPQETPTSTLRGIVDSIREGSVGATIETVADKLSTGFSRFTESFSGSAAQ